MTPGTHARADDAPARPRRTRTGWRLGTPTVVLVCGALFVVSAANSEGTDLRPGRYTDLASLVQTESDQYAELEDRVRELNDEVDALAAAVEDDQVKRLQRSIDEMEDPAGLTPRTGPGVTVTLSDAPEEVINSTSRDLNLLVVHQQDIQAVVNALWKGGATAVTVQGQRVVSTTGIKCEGSSVLLQGIPYPQPYVVSGIGDQEALLDALADDRGVAGYREAADDPAVDVGFDVDLDDDLEAPGFSGVLDLQYAEPLG